MNLRLYELGSAVHALAELMEEGEEGWQAILDELTENFQDKVINCAKLIKTWEAEEEVYKTEIARLQAHMKAAQHRQEWMKGYLKANMEEAGVDHVKGDVVDIRLQESPLSVNVPDNMAVPHAYLRGTVLLPWVTITQLGLLAIAENTVMPTVDKKAILKEFQTTETIPPGVTIEHGKHIRIR